ncbi:MAG: DNA recombination protein RmuC [Minwuia sp.]|uniref:DNA recombination protein RmuC n=1 Tax=Minwuia sp. TaxID=2493630 RepID=UPI003A86C9C7
MEQTGIQFWQVVLAAGAAALLVGIALWLAVRRSLDGRSALDAAETARREAEGRAERLDEAVRRLEVEKAGDEKAFREQVDRLQEARDQISAQAREIATLTIEKQKDAEHAEARIRELGEAREKMSKEFRLLAEEVMEKHGQTFKQQNREQLDVLLNPLRQKIVEFQTGMTDAQKQAAAGRAQLSEQIRHLSEHSSRMTQETVNLTRALKGRAQTQGAWGEMVLATILEKSGLREGEEYVTQQSETIDGQRLRPDVVINLPNDHKIIVDSKVSLVAFEEFVNAENDELRDAALKRHVTSMRAHVNELAKKDYSRISGQTLDYEIMFVPIEAAVSAALQADPALTAFAIEKNIAIATPTNLMMALRTVGGLWQVERQQKNAEQIADRAGKLYDKFEGFVSDMTLIGTHLERAQKAHGEAVGKLAGGSGNLVRQAEMLKDLGARTKKTLPQELVDRAGVEAIEAADD